MVCLFFFIYTYFFFFIFFYIYFYTNQIIAWAIESYSPHWMIFSAKTFNYWAERSSQYLFLLLLLAPKEGKTQLIFFKHAIPPHFQIIWLLLLFSYILKTISKLIILLQVINVFQLYSKSLWWFINRLAANHG